LRLAFDRATAEILDRVAGDHPTLRPAHLMIFRFGGINGSRGVDLAAHAGITKQSMHEILLHLEQHGYLERRAHSEHPRARVVELTGSGRALERQFLAAIAEVVEGWAEQVGEERLAIMWSALESITGQPAAPTDPSALRTWPTS
jgi:DNA-binding MarR family transcriptional regulator